MKWRMLEAVTLITGTIIGAGVLGLPFVASRAGFFIALIHLVVLGTVSIALNLLVGEISLRTRAVRYLAGFGGEYLGRVGKIILTTALLFSMWFAMVAFMIGEGSVGASLFGGAPAIYSMIYLVLVAFIVFFGIEAIKPFEMVASIFVMTVLLIIILSAGQFVRLEHLVTVSGEHAFLPFGVMLFALAGMSAIPHLEGILDGHQTKMRRAIIIGGLIPIVLYALFMLVVVGVTGPETTEVATLGLGKALGGVQAILGYIFAGSAMLTSGVSLGLSTRRLLKWDLGMSTTSAWLCTFLVPLVIFFIGIDGFVKTMGLVGAVFGTIISVLMTFVFWRARHQGDIVPHRFQIHHWLIIGIAVIVIYVVGAVLSLKDLW